MPELRVTMGLHECKIPECTIFAEVVVPGFGTFVFDEAGYTKFVRDFNEQVELVLPLDPTLER